MPADRPNVLLIMTDQHRSDLMSCAGDSFVPTPNIDRIARRGVRFTNAYSAYPVCVAARMAFLTGLYAHQAGIGHMMGDYGLPSYQGDLNDKCLTFAEAVKPAGYRTYMSAKHPERVTELQSLLKKIREQGFSAPRLK